MNIKGAMLKKTLAISALLLLLLSTVSFATETVMLQNNTLEDIDISFFDNMNEESYRILMKFDISFLAVGRNIVDAKLFLYRNNENGWSSDINIYRLENQTWTEDYDAASLWSMNTQRVNLQEFENKWTANGWDWVDVTEYVKADHGLGNENISLWLEDPNFNDSVPNNVGNHLLGYPYLYLGRVSNINNYTAFRSSENSKALTTPYLNVTFDDTPTYYSNISQLVDIFTGSGYSNFSISWDDDSGSMEAYLENNFSGALVNESMTGNNTEYYYNSKVLPTGTYKFRFVAVDSVGNDNATDFQYFTVEKGLLNLSLLISPYITVFNPTQTTTVGTENNIGDKDVVYELWRDSSLIANNSPYQDISTFSEGSYLYIFNATEGQNWSASSVNITLTVQPSVPAVGGTIITGGGFVLPPEEEAEKETGEEAPTEKETVEEMTEEVPEEQTTETTEETTTQEASAPTGLFLGLESDKLLMITGMISAVIVIIYVVLWKRKKPKHVLEKSQYFESL